MAEKDGARHDVAMPDTPGPTFSLNHTEHCYVAFDGAMGSMVQPYLLQFNAPLAEATVRQLVRELVSVFPRLRGVAEAGAHFYHLRILPDGAVIDQKFEHAWRVDAHVDATDDRALEALHNRLLNEVLPLEHGLGCRFVFIPHERTPVLFFCMHHMLGDGRTMIALVTALLRRLNGEPTMPVQPVEDPSLLGALKPAHWWQWPQQMWRSRRHQVTQACSLAGLHALQVCSPQGPYLSVHALRHYTVPCRASALRPLARRLGISVNSLIMLALAETYLAQAPDDPQAAAVIRQSLDLRPYFPKSDGHGSLWGNHVGAFLVIETGRKSLSERAQSIKAQVDAAVARYERREMFWGYAWFSLVPWLGRTLLGSITVNMLRKRRGPRISCHATSLGNVADLHRPDDQVRLLRWVPGVPSLSMMHIVSELNDQIIMPLSWQLCEAGLAHMDAYLRRLDEVFLGLAESARKDAGTSAPLNSTSCGSS